MRSLAWAFALALGWVTSPAKADPHSRGHRHHRHHTGAEGAFSVWVGAANLDADALDQRLERAGYLPREERSLFLGLEARKVFASDLVLGLSLSGTRGQRTEGPNGIDARLSSHHFGGEIGFALAKNERWLVYPAFVAGGYRLKLDIDASRSDDFDAVLSSPGRGVELSQSGAFVGGLLAVDRRFFWRNDSRGFVSLGLRLGVMQGVSARGFRLGDDSKATGSPETLPLIRFAAVSVGFGRKR